MRIQLHEAIKSLEDKWNRYFYVSEERGPETLYHYTSVEGFRGIISRRMLWASDVLSATDPSEVRYGLQLAAELLADRKDRIPIYKALLANRLYGMGDVWNVFISCFCEQADLCNQWRDYSANGCGYSIGMRRTALIDLARERQQYTLFPVIYDVARQREIVDTLINEEGFEMIKRLQLEGWELFTWWREIGIQLLTFILRFKNPKFEREKEWRILSLQRLGDEEFLAVRDRTRDNTKISYVQLPLDESSISSVVEGPCSTLGTTVVRELLDQNGFCSARIDRSGIFPPRIYGSGEKSCCHYHGGNIASPFLGLHNFSHSCQSGAVKHLTRSQLQSRKKKAVRFVRDVLGDPDRADEIAKEPLEDYAERRKIQITNPSKRRNAIMATTKSKAELEAENADLRDENQDLQDQLDAIRRNRA